MLALIKIAISVAIIVAVGKVAEKSGNLWAGFLLSLPLTSLLGIVWVYLERRQSHQIAAISTSTFWFVLIPLPSFLLLAFLLRRGLNFWFSLSLGLVLMFLAYLVTIKILLHFGYRL